MRDACRRVRVGSGSRSGPDPRLGEFVLRMHPQNPTPYQFVGLNWN